MKHLLKRLIIPLALIDKHTPQTGTIIDLGCGEGTITNFLAKVPTRQLIGVDLDKNRIKHAKQNTSAKNIKYKLQNIVEYKFPKSTNAIIISDVFHHLSRATQTQLLKQISSSLKKNSTLIIKEINASDMIRSKLSRLWDYIFYPQDKINYFSQNQLLNTLKKLGFNVNHIQTNHLVPASIHLYIATKT